MKNKLMFNIIMIILFTFLFIGLSSASLDSMGVYKKGESINICQVCSDATYITTTIKYPNSTIALLNDNLTSLGSGVFCDYFNSTNIIGRFEVIGISNGCEGSYATYFMITPSGEILSTGTSLIYFLVTLFAFFIFIGVGWLFLNINGENPKDETGYLGINYRKYIKTALFPLVYVSFIWFFNFIIGLSNNYLGLTLYSETLGFIFLILMRLTLPVIIVTVIIEIVLMIKDSNITKEYQSLWSRY